MSRKKIIIGTAVVLCGAAVFAFLKLRRGGGGGDAAEADDAAVPTIVSVQTAPLKRATLRGYVDGFGTVAPAPAEEGHPAATSRVASPVAGRLVASHAAEGQRVKQGDLLFELDARAATVAVNAARMAAERQQQLYDQHNASTHALQDAQSQLAAAEAQLALLRITAPLSGTVTRVGVRPGEAVDLSTVLAEISDLSRLVLAADLPSSQVALLRLAAPVEIQQEPPVAATLSFIGPTVDPASGTVAVRAALPSGSGLLPGQFVRFRIVVAVHADALVAPAASVVTDGDGRSVVAVVKGDAVALVPVKAGLADEGLVEVAGDGLSSGQSVVTVGAYGLPDKTKIHVVTP